MATVIKNDSAIALEVRDVSGERKIIPPMGGSVVLDNPDIYTKQVMELLSYTGAGSSDTGDAPSISEEPVITGTGVAGSEITIIDGEWVGEDTVAGILTVGETEVTVTAGKATIPANATVGADIKYRETATNKFGSVYADSNVIEVIAGGN